MDPYVAAGSTEERLSHWQPHTITSDAVGVSAADPFRSIRRAHPTEYIVVNHKSVLGFKIFELIAP